MKQLKELLLVTLMALLLGVPGQEDSAGGDSGQGDSCEHDQFYCNYQEPSVFYRCINQNIYTFHCPTGLHFSADSQTCDWPHSADCSAGEVQAELVPSGPQSGVDSAYTIEGDSRLGDRGDSNEVSRDQDKVTEVNEAGGKGVKTYVSQAASSGKSWLSQAASGGRSWWRPEGIKPQQWRDVQTIKKPAFKPHVPDEPKSDSENLAISSPKKSENKNAPTASVDIQESPKVPWKSGSCSRSCRLPDCFCAGNTIPLDLPASSVPQMVMLTFDDEVSAAYYGYFQRLFRPGRYNPNGCPIRGGLFVSGSGTDYDLVYPLYAMGIEIASHTVSHRFPHTWWASASYQDYINEAEGMRDNLVKRSGIPRESIKGYRVPFLQLGGDNMYNALYDSQFVYDTSMFTGDVWEGDDPIWPFTLDYVPNNTYCQHGPCPTKQYPGMWEIPVQRWYGLDGHSCAQPDGCSSTGDIEESLEYFKSNFRRFHRSNRAPFGIFVHARWFHSDHQLDGLDKFISYLLSLDDVYLVTPSQVIEWMRQPTPLSQINRFAPWTCQGGAKDVWTNRSD